MATSLAEAVWSLEEGYCLWVGAGLTRQAADGYCAVPLWDQITSELETRAGIPTDGKQDFPKRLDKCLAALGERAFRSQLRERYYTELCVGLLSMAAKSLDADDPVPDPVRAIAALGQLANPIVSFNIEPLSTLLLARSAGPVRIVFQQLHGTPACTWHEQGGRFQRLAYHPHGLATADMVMTSSQYAANSQTLAFGVAIHAAFENSLAIVGMSLDDEYLRRQIEQNRGSIGKILWFNSQFSEPTLAWASRHRITTVQSPWSHFWNHWRSVPVELEPRDLAAAWYLAISEATEEAEGGSLGELERSLRGLRSSDLPSELTSLAANLAKAGDAAAEPGKLAMVDGRHPRSIELALRERLLKAHVPLPFIAKTHASGPRSSSAA